MMQGRTCQLWGLWLMLWCSTWAHADAIDSFLERHWQRPLTPQGQPPAHYSELEASLKPEDCGRCHPQQFNDWRTSLHSRAMGPGLMGQLIDMPAHARGDHQSCLRCHAPLAEQADALVDEITTGQPTGLHRQGLVCAGCHVRQHQRFGPPRRDGSVATPGQALAHNGWQASQAFEDSRFCAACHQFEADEFALNGKLLENTYNEWRNSRYARDGVSCQQCHMPDRQHRWRGIHDPTMVRTGVEIQAQLQPSTPHQLSAQLALTNSGTGHQFPTYVTPQVVLAGYQLDSDGNPIDGTQQYFVVARRVALDLSEEIFDTRLAPGQTASLDYHQPRADSAVALLLQVWVEPDFFYQQFYQSQLDNDLPQRGRQALQQALQTASQSRYTLFEQRLRLDPIAASQPAIR